MAASSAMKALCLALCASLAHGAPQRQQSLRLSIHRDTADAQTENARLQMRNKATDNSGTVPTELGKSLYWFANFTVGDSRDLRLLIDTGSTDLILNPGLYKPSKHAQKYPGHFNFSTGYEGVNRAGFGFETLKGNVHLDQVSSGGLTVVHQAVGNCTSFAYQDVKPLPEPNQGNGIIGLGSSASSAFKPQADSWFYSLCETQVIKDCIMGLAYGTDKKGTITFGEVANDLIDGKLVNVPQVGRKGSFSAYGDITVDNKIVATKQLIIMDDGTDNIQAGLAVTEKVFKKLGIKPHFTSAGTGADHQKTARGFFDCDKPPTIGFSFPTQGALKKGEKATNFNVSPKVWDVYKHGNNNCTSILGGTSFLNPGRFGEKANGVWLLGQPFFQTHYVNFDVDKNTLGYGKLKNPATAEP